jgi:hypothetical protein
MEVVIATGVLFIGAVFLAGVLLSVHKQRENSYSRGLVLDRAISVMEEIRGHSPEFVLRDYDGVTYNVSGVTGTLNGGHAIAVDVDATDPKLVKVGLDASWTESGNTETLEVNTEVYSSRGQVTTP